MKVSTEKWGHMQLGIVKKSLNKVAFDDKSILFFVKVHSYADIGTDFIALKLREYHTASSFTFPNCGTIGDIQTFERRRAAALFFSTDLWQYKIGIFNLLWKILHNVVRTC